ncbi:hypothetical protein B0T22DRAFT_383311 [Podospora appendiculata]|uniref:Serum paraoxonase/arylesterase n=1 Tax=Podospora appendiculata TaxID=314037 RepID=A0AAE0X6X5_9PEZI|nr:hypothetical protein B0T22DRAFT_383311 [Podospora appendiculata]
MRGSSLLATSFTGALLAYTLYTWGALIHRTLTVFGALRWQLENTHAGQDIVAIADTTHCEDIHYHAPSATLFTACEDNADMRFKWFPPLTNFDRPELAAKGRGSIHVIDPNTLQSRRLVFENFDGPFITHGIDVISDLERPDGEAVYIFAVNHVPNPSLPANPGQKDWPKARSQVELFHHVIGAPTVRHIRSVWDPLIRTPNDVVATSPTSFYVTNDHYYAEHGLMRTIEDLYANAEWTDVIHVRLDPAADPSTITDPSAGVAATVALPDIHNGNGLGHGRSVWELLITSCASGVLHVGQISPNGKGDQITFVDQVEIDSVIDNPSYFSDPFAGKTGEDHSGFVLAGLARAYTLASTHSDPSDDARDSVRVWYVKPAPGEDKVKEPTSPVRWEKQVVFADDGTHIRSASAAVLVAIDPAAEEGGPVIGSVEGKGSRRKAWLFVTGFVSKNVIAVKVDL